VNNTQITNVVLAILADNHELGFPKFLVVRNLIMVSFTFTNLEDTMVTLERDLEILKLLSVNALKLHVEFVGSGLVRVSLKDASLQVRGR